MGQKRYKKSRKGQCRTGLIRLAINCSCSFFLNYFFQCSVLFLRQNYFSCLSETVGNIFLLQAQDQQLAFSGKHCKSITAAYFPILNLALLLKRASHCQLITSLVIPSSLACTVNPTPTVFKKHF